MTLHDPPVRGPGAGGHGGRGEFEGCHGVDLTINWHFPGEKWSGGRGHEVSSVFYTLTEVKRVGEENQADQEHSAVQNPGENFSGSSE